MPEHTPHEACWSMETWQFTCPPGWEVISRWGEGYALRSEGLRVIVDCERKSDGKYWLHVSVSRKDWSPSHEDMAKVKRSFIGDRRYAYSVWPPAKLYVNIHPNCLHLWALMESEDGRVLPEFSDEIEGIGKSI